MGLTRGWASVAAIIQKAENTAAAIVKRLNFVPARSAAASGSERNGSSEMSRRGPGA